MKMKKAEDKVIIYGFTSDVWNSEDRRGCPVALVSSYVIQDF